MSDFFHCPHYSVMGAEPGQSPSSESDGLGLVPWVGSTLGVADLPFVAGRAQPLRIGVLGAKDSGKTTFLAAKYLFLANGGRVGGLGIAGSYTLGGWESLAHRMRWFGEVPPSFPEHTASNTAREPGFLHLALSSSGRDATDMFLADSPGEWFEEWAFNIDAELATGAAALQLIADAFVLIVDSKALAAPASRGEARSVTEALAQRLSNSLRDRPVAVVWTKTDVVVPPTVRTNVGEAVARFLPTAKRFEFSVLASAPAQSAPETAIPQIFEWISEASSKRRIRPLEFERRRSRAGKFDAFFLMGLR